MPDRRLLPVLIALTSLCSHPGGCSSERHHAAATSSSEPPAVKRLTLRVASYNAWLLPLASRDLDLRLGAMAAAIDALEPNLLCLQEVWFSGGLQALRRGLDERLPHHVSGGGGLALLSQYPVVEHRFHPFADDDALSLVERIGGKGALEVLLATPAGLLRVLVSHLALDRRGEGGHQRQLDQLVVRLGEDPELPTVLCADLNLSATRSGDLTSSYRRLLGLGYADTLPPSRLTGGRFGRRPGTRVGWPRREPRRRGWDPDYLMARSADSGARLLVVGGRTALDDPRTALSDHNLLLGDLVLEHPTQGRSAPGDEALR